VLFVIYWLCYLLADAIVDKLTPLGAYLGKKLAHSVAVRLMERRKFLKGANVSVAVPDETNGTVSKTLAKSFFSRHSRKQHY